MTIKGAILIVDKDQDSVNVLTGILQGQGHQVRSAASSVQALANIRRQRPALIMIAAHMLGAGGLEVCRRLKRRQIISQIPVLLITSHAEKAEREEGLRLGVADFLCRPFDGPEVIARVRTHLELAGFRTHAERPMERLSADSADAPPERDEWIHLAMQTGRMVAFNWILATDEIYRSHDYAEILGLGCGASTRDTGQNWLKHIHVDDRERYLQVLAILSPAYDACAIQYRVSREDGRTIHLRESLRALFDGDGKLTRVIGVIADVTDQVQTEKALERRDTELLKLLQKVPIAVAFANEAGQMQFVNDRFVRNFGYQLDEIAEPEAWWQRAYPDERYRREVVSTWDESVSRAVREGNDIAPREYQIACKDGSTRTVEVFGATLGEGKLILLDDITERKRAESALRESEERFRIMADTAPVMLWVSGPDRLCTFFNKGWLTFTGRTMEQELGNGWAENVHPEDLERCVGIYRAAFDARENFQMEYRLRNSAGEYRWIVDCGVPRFSADGAFAGYIGSGLDITEIRRNQEQMLASQKLESLGVLASGIAHDFNNLLGCILADVEVTAAEVGAGSPARAGLERIATVAIRGAEIVRQIMTYAGQEQANLGRVDISELVQELLNLLRVCVPKNSRLNVHLPGELPVARANASQLRQVLMNLILNAAEAIGEENGVITISARREHLSRSRSRNIWSSLPDGDYICIEVSDTGSGMSEETRIRIFDPFFSTKVAGRGLGLAAVRGIVRGHGGAIDVKSIVGKGTTFQILLPCDGKPGVPHSAARAAPEGFDVGKGSILVVEDEDTLRLSVSRVLRKRGFSVLEARDGNLAVDLIRARKENIAVVLLDLNLPGKSSHDVIEELRRARPGVKLILTSAYGRDSLSETLDGLQEKSFIRKPYHLSELVSEILNALPQEADPVTKLL